MLPSACEAESRDEGGDQSAGREAEENAGRESRPAIHLASPADKPANQLPTSVTFCDVPNPPVAVTPTTGSEMRPTVRRLILFSIYASLFCKGTLVCILAPFFPHEVSTVYTPVEEPFNPPKNSLMYLNHPSSQAELKGMNPTQYGLVFACFTFGQLLIAPASGAIVARLTPRFSCILGIIVMAAATIAFAFIHWLPPGWIYFVIAVLFALISSTGSALLSTATFTLIAVFFADNLATHIVSPASL